MNRSPHDRDVETKPHEWRIGSIALIILLYALVSGLALSGFVLYLDFSTELVYGPTNTGELCSWGTKTGIGFWTNNDLFCFVRLEYVALILVSFPLTTVFWQALFGFSVLIAVIVWRRCVAFGSRCKRSDRDRVEDLFSPFAVATMLYLIGVFVIGGVHAITFNLPRSNPEWRGTLLDVAGYLPLLDVYSGIGWQFLLAPVPVFMAFVYVRRRGKK